MMCSDTVVLCQRRRPQQHIQSIVQWNPAHGQSYEQ